MRFKLIKPITYPRPLNLHLHLIHSKDFTIISEMYRYRLYERRQWITCELPKVCVMSESAT